MPMLNNDGQVSEILSVSRDITARKKAELALQEKNRELENFARIVSHDLKAPLRGISNLSEWIFEDLETQLPAETKQHIALLQQRVQKMQCLVDGLLQVSRLGKQDLVTEEIEMHSLL